MEGSDEKEYSDDMVCPEDVYLCEDGTVVSRNPYMNCEFDPCPEYSVVECPIYDCPMPEDCDSGMTMDGVDSDGCFYCGCAEKDYSDDMVCPEDAYICEDGTVVTRNPYMNCEFDECPDYSETGDMSYDECKDMVVCGCQPHQETVEYMDENGCVTSCQCVDMEGSDDTAGCSITAPCAAGSFCNYDYGSSGMCEPCMSSEDECMNDGLPEAGAQECVAVCVGDMSMDMPCVEEVTCGCQPPMETVEYMDEMGCVRRCDCVDPEYSEDMVCALDVMDCGDGTYVSRDPMNNCEFYMCEIDLSMVDMSEDVDVGCGEEVVCGCKDGLETVEYTDENGCVTRCECVEPEYSIEESDCYFRMTCGECLPDGDYSCSFYLGETDASGAVTYYESGRCEPPREVDWSTVNWEQLSTYEVTSNTGCPADTTSEDMSMDMCPEMSCGCQPPMETVEYMDEMGCVRRCECVDPEYSEDMVCAADLYDCGNDMYVMRDPENNCEFYPCEMETSMDIDFGTEGESM